MKRSLGLEGLENKPTSLSLPLDALLEGDLPSSALSLSLSPFLASSLALPLSDRGKNGV
jgi:hypothetical protein